MGEGVGVLGGLVCQGASDTLRASWRVRDRLERNANLLPRCWGLVETPSDKRCAVFGVRRDSSSPFALLPLGAPSPHQ